MLKGFKTKLAPNNEQQTKFAQHCGVARWTYNWGLAITHQAINTRNEAREKGEKLPKFPSAIDLHKQLNAEVKPEHEWFYQSSKCAPQQALRDLENAWKRKLKVKGSGAPSRKKKFVNDHFYLEGAIRIKDGFIQLPRIGLVKLHEQVSNQKIKSVTVSRKANDWFVSFKVEFESSVDGGSNGLTQSCPPVIKDPSTPTDKLNTRVGNFEQVCARGESLNICRKRLSRFRGSKLHVSRTNPMMSSLVKC